MKRHYIFISLLLSILLPACSPNAGKEQESLEQISKQELATALNERDRLLALVKEVAEGLNEIKQLENIMTIAAQQPSENPRRKTQLLADIANIKKKIQQRKERLDQLESDLRDSTINGRELRETIEAIRTQFDSQMEEIESLRRQLTEAHAHIGALNDSVDSLNATVSAITDERNDARETSLKLENELNTCYYIVATKTELKKYHIIESAFLRKTELMKGDFDKGSFVICDRRTLTSIPLLSKSVKILSNHPGKSYEIHTDDDGMKTLRILNSEKFWSLSNYLVVQKN